MLLKKTHYWRDVLFGTLFIFFVIYALGNLMQALDILDPVGEALADMETTDLVFSSDLRETPMPDERIVLVNLGNLDRRGIAQMISIVNQYEPAAIGLDAIFRTQKPDTLGDLMLAEALTGTENLVMYAKLEEPDDDGVWHKVTKSHPMFTQDHMTAHVNLVAEVAGIQQFQFKTCRSFFPNEKLLDPETGEIVQVPAFAVKLAELYDPEKSERFLARAKDEELINYRGNIIDFGRTKLGTRFFALDWDQVLNLEFTPDLIKDKIVIFGFLGAELDDTRSFEDKYFTPLNVKYAGRANPDMYGAVVHANIVSMILNEDYLSEMKETAAIIFAIIACILNVMLFQWIYIRLPKWYDGLTKLTQLVEALFFLFAIVMVFHLFSFKLNLTYGIIVVLLSGDSLEVYNGVIKNLFSAERRRQLFTIQKD